MHVGEVKPVPGKGKKKKDLVKELVAKWIAGLYTRSDGGGGGGSSSGGDGGDGDGDVDDGAIPSEKCGIDSDQLLVDIIKCRDLDCGQGPLVDRIKQSVGLEFEYQLQEMLHDLYGTQQYKSMTHPRSLFQHLYIVTADSERTLMGCADPP